MVQVRDQLSSLWSPQCVQMYFQPLIGLVSKLPDPVPPSPVLTAPNHQMVSPVEEEAPVSAARQFFRRAIEKTRTTTSVVMAVSSTTTSSDAPASSSGSLKIGTEPVHRVAMVCTMYQAALRTLSQLKLEILQASKSLKRIFEFFNRTQLFLKTWQSLD